ncbi:MAG: lipid-A-disaccharide synthase [Holophagaceae bacterium]|nr:lipid-A-disaccharide synthase [Holophagaceae bacterium]
MLTAPAPSSIDTQNRSLKAVLVVAGEASGDLHGAEILRELKALQPDLRIVGIGGEGMSPFMDRKLADVRDLGVVGFVEVIRHYPAIRRLYHQLLQVADQEDIGAVLTIDYPGLNLKLAQALRKRRPGIRLHHFVCPQVWAWKAGRIPMIGRTLDALYCLFDFEPRLFEDFPVEALWIGNPLVEKVKPELSRDAFFQQSGLDPSRPLVALLPGSRWGEVQRLLPVMVEMVRRWQDPGTQWVLPVANTLSDDLIQAHIRGTSIRPVRDLGYAARAYADAALVCSGTATLETALLGTPFAILYKLHPLSYALAKLLVRVKHFGLANIVAGQEVAPELLQGQVSPEALERELKRLLDPTLAPGIRSSLAALRSRLGEPGAAKRVATHFLESIPKA